MTHTQHDLDRFWAKVNRNGPTVRPEIGPCHDWTAATSERGYGVFHLGGRAVSATRFILSVRLGRPLAEGMEALHACDRKICVRPSHLREGTQADNLADAVARRRMAHSDRRATKLTTEQVQDIKNRVRAGEKQADIAKRHGIHQTTVSRVYHGKRWIYHQDAPSVTN